MFTGSAMFPGYTGARPLCPGVSHKVNIPGRPFDCPFVLRSRGGRRFCNFSCRSNDLHHVANSYNPDREPLVSCQTERIGIKPGERLNDCACIDISRRTPYEKHPVIVLYGDGDHITNGWELVHVRIIAQNAALSTLFLQVSC